MKKFLFITGLAGIGYSFYYYLNQQLKLALDFDYKLENLKINELTSEKADIEAAIRLTNKSSFKLIIKSYYLEFIYDKYVIATTRSRSPIILKSDSSFIVKALGTLNFKQSLKALLPFIKDIIGKKPINITINGKINTNFLALNHTVELDNEVVNYSTNLLADIGMENTADKIKAKADNLLGQIGIKI